jgi:hypothetical protein
VRDSNAQAWHRQEYSQRDDRFTASLREETRRVEESLHHAPAPQRPKQENAMKANFVKAYVDFSLNSIYQLID